MAFTLVAVTGKFESNGLPMAGTLTFTLNQPLQNGNVIAPATPTTVTLDGNGAFETELYAADDTATVPQGVWYGVTEQLTGCQPRDYFIFVSQATNPVDLSVLMPGQPGYL